MDKKDFILAMKKIIKNETMCDKLEDAIAELSPDTYRPVISFHTTLALDIIQLAMKDTSGWIDYWMYDLEKGKEYKDGTITEKGGKIIKLKTLSQLYDCINNKKAN